MISRHDRFDTFEDAERKARRRLPRTLFTMLDSGTSTKDANRRAFDEMTFRPRAAVSFDERVLATTVLGVDVSLPVLLAPTGSIRIVHPDGEIAAARAAHARGTICAISHNSGYSFGAVAQASDGPLWGQVYLRWGRAAAEQLIGEAVAAACSALVVTVDVPIGPPRTMRPFRVDLRNAARFGPEIAARPRWFLRYLREGLRARDVDAAMRAVTRATATSSWDDVQWVRQTWPGPLVVKGVVTADDAKRAVDAGASAVVVSNHGGKALEGAPGTMRALPNVLGAVGDQVEVLVDGGVRHGTDVVKAVAAGARAVLIGRAFVWGLAVGGEDGVRRTLEIFADEIDRSLALLGCPSIQMLDGSYLEPRA